MRGGGSQAFLSQLPLVIVYRVNDLAVIPRDVAFFSIVCAETLPPPPSPYFDPKPNLSKTLESLLMQLVIFVNTISQLNSLTFALSVCYVSGSKVNRKERSRTSVFVC